MRTKFAAIIGMIAVMAFSALPAQAAAGADAQQHAVTRRESAFAETNVFRHLANGWHYTKGNWYYIRGGRAVKGWIRDSGKWYFLGRDGRMQTGWIKDGGKWYYLAPGGAMQTGWVKYNGKWYYLAAGGAMKTGWLKIGKQTYYMTNGGVRVTGWRTIDGKRYCFRSNGVLDVSKTKKANAARKKSEDQASAQSGTASGKKAKTKGELVADYALRFVGNPYVYGGCSLTQGTDCSGFVMLIYRHFGVELPHYDAAIRTRGKSVPSLKEARAGDIICYYGHVAIYLGDGRIVHASNSRDGIKISERADYRTIASIRRIFE